MTCQIAHDYALSRDVQQPAGPFSARRYGKRPVGMRARVLIASALTAVAALLALVVWLDTSDWRRLLLFGCIVGMAALGGGRTAPVAVSRRHDHAPQERIV